MHLASRFDLQSKVHIDGDKGVVGVVTMIEWRGTGSFVRYEVSWFHEGRAEFTVFDEWRLTGADE